MFNIPKTIKYNLRTKIIICCYFYNKFCDYLIKFSFLINLKILTQITLLNNISSNSIKFLTVNKFILF